MYDTSDLLNWFVRKGYTYDHEKACKYIDFTDQYHLNCLKKHLLESKLELDINQEFLFVNCLNYGDPLHDKELRSHKGTHPKTLLGIAEQTRHEHESRLSSTS